MLSINSWHFLFVEYVDIISRYNHSFDNFVCKLINIGKFKLQFSLDVVCLFTSVLFDTVKIL